MSNTQSIDLHVHSKYAGRFKLFVLNSLEVEECYSEPEDVYQRLMARGMSMVTITDHDAIEGCLEIAHHGSHVFLSEEVSARFPDNGCIVHMLVYGITEAQHLEIQRLRRDIYQLVPYLRAQQIPHALAHPFSTVNQRLTPGHLQRSLLMFDTLEAINGQKDPGHERFVRRVIERVDRGVLARWAEDHRLPVEVDVDRRWGIVGGSDDHSGVTMASGYTRFDGPATFDGLRRAIAQRATTPVGVQTKGTNYAHTAHIGALNYFIHSHRTDSKPTYMHLVDLVRSRKLPASLEDLSPVMRRLIPSALAVLGEREDVPTAERLRTEGHTPKLHDELYDIVQRSLLGAFREAFDQIKRGVETRDPEPIIDELPTLLRLALFNVPYYFGFRFFHGERGRARALYESLGVGEVEGGTRKIALFCDTIDNVDGVNIGLRRIVEELQADGREVFLCGPALGKQDWADGDEVVRFPTVGEFPLLGYEQYTLGWPSFVEVLRWLDDNEIEAVGLTTPGPMGLVGMAACRMLGIPTVGQYHTNVAEYAFRLIGDRTIGRMVRAYTSWFYAATGDVVAPSLATAEILAHHGIRGERVHVVRRGVDASLFDPARRVPGFFQRFGLARQTCTLVYVGRVSVEKNLPFLAEVVAEMLDEGADFQLAVVGEGPWLSQMKARLAGYPVAFTGYLRGDELATAFASADVFVFPSTTDTFGNVVLEALASGTPALVSDVGGPAEIVQHGETGWILPADDLHAWQRAIGELVDEPKTRQRMRDAARRYAVARTFEQAREDLWEVYAHAIAEHRQRGLDELNAAAPRTRRSRRAVVVPIDRAV